MVGTKFENRIFSTHMNNPPINIQNNLTITESLKQIVDKASTMPFNRSFPEILAYGNSKEFPAHLEKMHNSAYDAADVSAILLIECTLRSSESSKFVQLKSSLKVKFHLILGNFYLKLEQNNEALKYYEFALKQNKSFII
ncbi:unnamed protein product [Rotaria sp. Silwood2]|nr:unnamed protein product [Rotaria sp. Silwood2]